jgi:hypothetical protein
MVEELNEIYSDIKEDEACNTVVLYGASDKAFCAGGAAFPPSAARHHPHLKSLLPPLPPLLLPRMPPAHFIGERWLHDKAASALPLSGSNTLLYSGDVALLAKQKPAPIGQPCPQMDFFRKEYTLNMVIHNLVNTISPTTHVSPIHDSTLPLTWLSTKACNVNSPPLPSLSIFLSVGFEEGISFIQQFHS